MSRSRNYHYDRPALNFLVYVYRYCYANRVKVLDTLSIVKLWLYHHAMDDLLGIFLDSCLADKDLKGNYNSFAITPSAKELLHKLTTIYPRRDPLKALSTCADSMNSVADALNELGVPPERIRLILEKKDEARKDRGRGRRSDSCRKSDWKDLPNFIEERPGELDGFCTDLTELAKHGELAKTYGREAEVKKMTAILLRRTKANPLLIGDAGVGKSAVVEGLAHLIVSDSCPAHLKDHRILSVSMGGMMSGTSLRGQFEERLEKLVVEAKQDKTLLFIDELHTIMSSGKTLDTTLDAANILKPYLARGEIRVIGATTRDEYERFICRDSAMERRFYVLEVEEPSDASTVTIVSKVADDLERYHKLTFKNSYIRRAVALSNDLLPHRRQPDKAIDLLDSACAGARSRGETCVSAERIDESMLEMLGSSSPVLGRRYTFDSVKATATQLDHDWKGWGDARSRFMEMAAIVCRRSTGRNGTSRPAVHMISAPEDAGACWFAEQMAASLLEMEDASIVLNWTDFANAKAMASLYTFLLSGLDGFVIIKGIADESHPAYSSYCEFIEEGLVRRENGKRKVGFTCSIVIIHETRSGRQLGFASGNSDVCDTLETYESLDLNPRLSAVIRPESLVCLGPIDKGGALDIVWSEAEKMGDDGCELPDAESILEKCETLTYSNIIDACRLEQERAMEKADEIIEFVSEERDVPVRSA